MLENNINLSQPDHPNTKKFLQELDNAILQQVVMLAEMHRNLCELNVAKKREEKVSEFLAESKHLKEIEDRLKENAKIINQAIESKSPSASILEALLATRDKLEAMEKEITAKIKEVQEKIKTYDIEIEKSQSNVNKLTKEVDEVISQKVNFSIKEDLKGQKIIVNNQEITVGEEHLNETQFPSVKELLKDQAMADFVAAETINEQTAADRIINYAAEVICRSVYMRIDVSAGTVEGLLAMCTNNPAASMQIKNKVTSQLQDCKSILIQMLEEQRKFTQLSEAKVQSVQLEKELHKALEKIQEAKKTTEEEIKKLEKQTSSAENKNSPAHEDEENENEDEDEHSTKSSMKFTPPGAPKT
jgi:hypothetical protein